MGDLLELCLSAYVTVLWSVWRIKFPTCSVSRNSRTAELAELARVTSGVDARRSMDVFCRFPIIFNNKVCLVPICSVYQYFSRGSEGSLFVLWILGPGCGFGVIVVYVSSLFTLSVRRRASSSRGCLLMLSIRVICFQGFSMS